IVGTSSKFAPVPMTRKDMIAALKDTCKGLNEKKLKFERMIQALELEEAVMEGENEAGEEEEDATGDDQEEDTDGSA
ncbi:hypothetical protein A2U01_0097777, partial [Trifolium medium]|nr:hypothetical protein [Trifolium medium]